MPDIFYVSIDYDEYDPYSYRGVVLTSREYDEEFKRFATGNPQKDWADYLSFMKENGGVVMTMSSVTHFLWDVPGWRMIEDDDGYEIIVREDRKSWLV